ncbi:MAG: CDP-alcohol phosphatidyltransferase family protein [Gammaproteobacteria bacterium]
MIPALTRGWRLAVLIGGYPKRGVLALADAVAHGLARYGVSPNRVTVISCLVSVAASIVFLLGYPIAAGLLFWGAGSFDMVDGMLARITGRVTELGGFLDSLLDRVGEASMFAAIAYRFATEGRALAATAVFIAMFGGMMTSYVRARAEILGIACAEGLVTRPERVILLVIGLLSGLLVEVIYLLALATLWTAGQRTLLVYRRLLARI